MSDTRIIENEELQELFEVEEIHDDEIEEDGEEASGDPEATEQGLLRLPASLPKRYAARHFRQ